MENPLTPEVLADPVQLTRALVDIESVSLNEKAIADCVEEVLRGVPHLTTHRHGNTVMARTDLGRSQRVVLAGHLDTVPLNNNFPSTDARRPDVRLRHLRHEVRHRVRAAPGGDAARARATT